VQSWCYGTEAYRVEVADVISCQQENDIGTYDARDFFLTNGTSQYFEYPIIWKEITTTQQTIQKLPNKNTTIRIQPSSKT
jgi:hypothetical protein